MAKHTGRQELPVANPLAPIRLEWDNCTRCPLHGSRTNVVVTRGTVPADICFLGSSPTAADDLSGIPLTGPSGNMLETIIREISTEAEVLKTPFTWCAVTTVGCVPWQSVEQLTIRPPDRCETDACLPRLLSLLKAIDPRGLVLLGNVANYYWDRYRLHFKQAGVELPILSVEHPNTAIHNGGARSDNIVYAGIKSSLRQFLFRNILPARRSSFG